MVNAYCTCKWRVDGIEVNRWRRPLNDSHRAPQEDRKWGLWVQGLFEEPKYPYIYFGLHTEADAMVLVETEEKDEDGKRKKDLRPLFGGAGIPGSRLDFRFNHARDQGRVLLSAGKVTYKEVEMSKVDPLGIGGAVKWGTCWRAGPRT